jgi:hypothetical protein
MGKDRVVIFKPFPLAAGQKIRIAGGPRSGDWLVIGISEKKIHLRCPISGQEVNWDHFCYQVETRGNEEWPRKD